MLWKASMLKLSPLLTPFDEDEEADDWRLPDFPLDKLDEHEDADDLIDCLNDLPIFNCRTPSLSPNRSPVTAEDML